MDDLCRYLGAAYALLTQEGHAEAASLLRSSTAKVVFDYYDNLNGGMNFYKLILEVPVGAFAEIPHVLRPRPQSPTGDDSAGPSHAKAQGRLLFHGRRDRFASQGAALLLYSSEGSSPDAVCCYRSRGGSHGAGLLGEPSGVLRPRAMGHVHGLRGGVSSEPRTLRPAP